MTLTLSTKSSIIPPMIKNRVNYAINKNQLRRYSSAVVTRSTNEAQQTIEIKNQKEIK